MRQSKPEPITEDEIYESLVSDETARAADDPVPLFKTQPIQIGSCITKPRKDEPVEHLPGGPKRRERSEVLNACLDILSFRLILTLCSTASAGLFFMAALWPDQWRLAAAAAFSVLVTAPAMYFYRRYE
jgi:hypothetical protein